MTQTSAARMLQIATLRSRIDQGTYHPEPHAIADALLRHSARRHRLARLALLAGGCGLSPADARSPRGRGADLRAG